MKKRVKLTRLPFLLFATFVWVLFSTTPGSTSTTAQVQADQLSATAGATSGATIMVDQQISGGEPTATADVTMERDPNQEDAVTGYLLYYGNASGKYLPPIDVGLMTNHTINDLSTKQKWFFAVKASAS